jgi:hypothetical protein
MTKDIAQPIALIWRFGLDNSRADWQNKEAILIGAWRSLVARLPWAQEVPGSNPGAPTMFSII